MKATTVSKSWRAEADHETFIDSTCYVCSPAEYKRVVRHDLARFELGESALDTADHIQLALNERGDSFSG